MPITWINGKYVPEDEIALSPNDRGFLYGDGAFETMRSVQSRIIALHAHIHRLKTACERLRIPLTQGPEDFRTIIQELLNRNALQDAYIRISISRGPVEQFGFGFSKTIKPTCLIAVRPAPTIPDNIYQKGISVGFQISSLFGSHTGDTAIKSLSAVEYVLAKQSALENKCYDMLLMDSIERVYEGTSSNVFIVRQGALCTPPVHSGILPGITRARVITLAETKLHLPVREILFSKQDVLTAEEVFLTNTNIDVLPVTVAGEQTIGNGVPGKITQSLLQLYRQTLIEILE
ncbi:MAG TPA: aminotransferase class IV [bacterium]|nr:aminotransferase class IV [bacterium]HMY36665.1 aminotransferase class IV [bacterium]HNB10392.1 aminotransferase class IV [bacterium]HNC49049.1 aminotransferase class IV [bacterium]HNF86652.1 aminotransferase class IV [bacterium]